MGKRKGNNYIQKLNILKIIGKLEQREKDKRELYDNEDDDERKKYLMRECNDINYAIQEWKKQLKTL